MMRITNTNTYNNDIDFKYGNKMMTKKKGISTFIATLLLMVLAVSAGVVIYAYTMGYLGGYGGTDTLGGMSLDQGKMTAVGPPAQAAVVYIRNIGSTDIDLTAGSEARAYVDGELATISVGSIIAEGIVLPITIVPGGGPAWAAGKTYQVKLIAVDNTQVSFNLKCDA
jgi:hypothetical protein